MKKIKAKNHGFTIVELLVVIVIIGILATISIVSYFGIRQRASVVVLMSDLSNAATQLGIEFATDNSYPVSETAADLKKSEGTVFQYARTEGEYCLSATSTAAGLYYHVSSSGGAVKQGGCLTEISGSEHHACAISNNQAYCWGDNDVGQLGNNQAAGTAVSSLVPVKVTTAGTAMAGLTFKNITTGKWLTCAIGSDYRAYCWGQDTFLGDLGDNSNINKLVPVAVVTASTPMNGKDLVAISSGISHTCALDSDGKAYCWGYNDQYQRGTGNTTSSGYPTAVSTALSFKSISAGDDYTCAVATDNRAYCWGDGSSGKLGSNGVGDLSVPTAVVVAGTPMYNKDVISISAGIYSDTCAITADGKAYCWGRNGSGELGIGVTGQRLVPVEVTQTGTPLEGKSIQSISVGNSHTCAVTTDGGAYCWGYDGGYGVLGAGTGITTRTTATAVVTAGTPMAGKVSLKINAGSYHNCAIDADFSAYCWGDNDDGELADGTTTRKLNPISMPNIP